VQQLHYAQRREQREQRRALAGAVDSAGPPAPADELGVGADGLFALGASAPPSAFSTPTSTLTCGSSGTLTGKARVV
jgi:hypothetical protein